MTANDAIAGALERARTDRTGAIDWTSDAYRGQLVGAFMMAVDDRAALAVEVERLTARLTAAERVVSAVRTTVELAAEAREWFPDQVLDALNAYDDTTPPEER